MVWTDRRRSHIQNRARRLKRIDSGRDEEGTSARCDAAPVNIDDTEDVGGLGGVVVALLPEADFRETVVVVDWTAGTGVPVAVEKILLWTDGETLAQYAMNCWN